MHEIRSVLHSQEQKTGSLITIRLLLPINHQKQGKHANKQDAGLEAHSCFALLVHVHQNVRRLTELYVSVLLMLLRLRSFFLHEFTQPGFRVQLPAERLNTETHSERHFGGRQQASATFNLTF